MGDNGRVINCLAGSADRRRQKRHWPQWTMFSQSIKKSAKCLQASPTDIAGTVGSVSKCHKTATWLCEFLNVRKSQLCFHIFHLTHCDSQASFFATVIWNEINHIYVNNKCVQESFSSMCARYFVRSLFLLSRDLAAPAHLRMCIVTSSLCNALLGQKGVD